MDFKVEERLHKNCPACERAAYAASWAAMIMGWPTATYEEVKCGKRGVRIVGHSARVGVRNDDSLARG
jgi:hypothetical protein